MSKVRTQAPAGSNNSATSSENSETQSVEDHQTALSSTNRSAASIRAKTSWKRMKDLAAEKEKENEAKRPPWRAVSVSTLPKPDKNALLRAKLLDASRRLRAGKANVAIQTDFVPTKLMKEASIGPQNDLILLRDAGVLTDGQYSIKKDGVQQYILTYSISQMTDSIDTADAYTQTLLPKPYNEGIVSSYGLDSMHSGNNEVLNAEKQSKAVPFLDFNEEISIPLESEEGKPGVKLSPTLASWHFDDDVMEMEITQHFIPYTIEAFKPWRSFVPLPFHIRGNELIGRQKIDWYALLQSIDDLVYESNNLVDKLESIVKDKKMQRKNVLQTLDTIRKFEPSSFKFPSAYWVPIIEEQELQLQKLMSMN